MKNALIAAALLSLTALPGPAKASSTTAAPSASYSSIFTPRGAAVPTGHFGNLQTTTLPGNGGVGILMNNGNGTSTLTGPDGMSTTVPTPG